MKLVHFSGLEKNIDCRNFDNIILSWNLRNSKYFEEYKIKDVFLVSKIWQKKKFFIKKKRDNLKKIILAQLYKKLNLINKIDYSQKNWEIILEPWLSHYVESNYFRWLIVESLILKYKNFKYFKIKVLKKIPEFDSIEFAEKNYSNDVFNHLSFQDILDFKTRSKKNKIVIKKKFLLNDQLFTRKKNSFLFLIYEKLIDKMCSNKLLIHIRMDKIDFFKLCFRINRFPFKGNFIFDRSKLSKIHKRGSFNKKKRSQINLKTKTLGGFDEYILKKIECDLPRSFLENFNDIKNLHNNKLTKTQTVITDTIHKYNTIFKSWLASKKNLDKNFKIITADHGGLHGNDDSFYDYDQAVSFDNIKYKIKTPKKEISLPSLFLKKKKNFLRNKILIICHDTSKYPSYFFSGPICEEIYFQFNQIKKLKKKLHVNLNQKILLRPYTITPGWKLSKKFEEIISKDKIINSKNDFNKIKNRAKINIVTYPKTAYLEALINGPTFLLFNRKHYSDTKQNKQFMNILFKNKLAFESGEKLAIHLNNTENNIHEWWCQKKIQSSINIYLKNTNIYEKDPTIAWSETLKKL